jgi:F-type H+-transporting ATPase subunit epsilon
MNTLHLIISSVSENVFDGHAVSVTVPGSAGEMTILPNHEPLITTLAAGTIALRDQNKDERKFPIQRGVLEVSGTRAVVLV